MFTFEVTAPKIDMRVNLALAAQDAGVKTDVTVSGVMVIDVEDVEAVIELIRTSMENSVFEFNETLLHGGPDNWRRVRQLPEEPRGVYVVFQHPMNIAWRTFGIRVVEGYDPDGHPVYGDIRELRFGYDGDRQAEKTQDTTRKDQS